METSARDCQEPTATAEPLNRTDAESSGRLPRRVPVPPPAKAQHPELAGTPEGDSEAFIPGWYTQQQQQPLVGPLSLEQALNSGLDDAAQWWWCDTHSYGPYTTQQLASQAASSRRQGYAAATAACLDPEEQRLSQLAKDAGTTLSDVVSFCRGASRYQEQLPATAVQEEGIVGQPEQEAATAEDIGGSCRGWRKLARLKKQRKAKKRTAWLLS